MNLIKTLFLSALIVLPPISHGETLKGMHDTIGGIQSDGLDHLTKLVSKVPEVFSSDFGYSTHPNDDYRKRAELLNKYIFLSKKVKILTLSYHQCRPDIQEPCTFNTGVANTDFNDKEWTELLTWNSPLNKLWQKQIKNLAEFISTLQSKNITLYLRPYHESNIPSFWWADVKKPTHSIELWKMLHKHLENDYKLKNIKWVWSLSFHPKYLSNLNAFYPGDEWVDVLGFDIYPPKKDTPPEFQKAWEYLTAISPNKPKALTEVSRLPALKELEGNNWLYVIPWGETMLKKENNSDEIKLFYK